MRKRRRLLLAVVVAASVAGLGAGAALASGGLELSVEGELGSVRAEARALTFSDEAATFTVICEVVRTISLHRSIAKVAGSLAGLVNRVDVSGCRGGTVRALAGPPSWHLTYVSFSGTLPSISSVRLQVNGAAWLLEALGGTIRCLFTGMLQETTVGSPVTELRLDETRPTPLAVNLGGSFCPSALVVRGTLRLSPAPRLALVAAPPPSVYVVSVGDSYISGEGGRWAGNTRREEARIDALGRDAYFDNERRTAETIERCHRSKEPEIRIGGAGVTSVNFACSGATVATRAGPPFKPGLDRVANSQLELLRDLATRHPREIKMVAVSIGGNDFGFGEIVERCILAYAEERRRLCSTDPAVTERVNAANVTAKTALIARAITEVRETMRNAGSADGEYRLVVQNYESPVPLGPGFRDEQEAEEGGGRRKKRATLGCGLWDADAEWANNTALVNINRAVADGIAATRLANVVPLKLETAFDGRRLCERGVDLIENTELRLGTEAGGADRLEWMNQVRVAVLFTEYFIQESLHPNWWAVLALRNCLRRTYVGGRAAATCTRNGAGLEGGEPRMQIR